MSCFDSVPSMVPCHRLRSPDTTHLNPLPLFIWNTHLWVCICVCVCVVSMFMCLFVIREGWADTSNGEKCAVLTQRCTRSFQHLSFDLEVQGWVMVWGKPKYLKMNGRKKALDVFQRENTSEWDTDLPHISAACQELNAGVHLSVSDRSHCGWKPLTFLVIRLD